MSFLRENDLKDINGGITAPRGFSAGTAECGIKHAGRPDLTIIVSDRTASCAGMFTTNRIKGAPVLVSRRNVQNGVARVIIANSGNANTCNGEDGLSAAVAMTVETARLIGCDPSDVLVASTGVIGRPFPMEKVAAGIPRAVAALSPDGGALAARAIMTTDTVPKETAVEFDSGEVPIRIGAIAKGAGMICPDMATLFCFITTGRGHRSFRSAKGAPSRGHRELQLYHGRWRTCPPTIRWCCSRQRTGGQSHDEEPLSGLRHIHRGASPKCVSAWRKRWCATAKGATKFITLRITGAASKEEARQVGLAIANSPLVKTAFYGNDPNWGRIICAAGYSGVAVDESLITIAVNGSLLFDTGRAIPIDEAEMRKNLSRPRNPCGSRPRHGAGGIHHLYNRYVTRLYQNQR